MLWPVIAAVLILATGDLAWEAGKTKIAGVFASGNRLYSSDPVAIRAWVKARTNKDVELNCGGAGKIQFAGARIIDLRDKLVAAISYRLDGNEGLMLVADRGADLQTASGDRSVWNRTGANGMGQTLALTYPPVRDMDSSCVSCHVDGHRQL